jgi:4-hydroxy-tetrahydrodipicolinate synthase
MNVERIEGMIPPIVVAFDSTEEIEVDLLRKDIRFLLSSGIDGICSGGSTSEGAVLSNAELRTCLEVIMEENTQKIPVLAGVIRNSTRDVISAALEAKSIGVDGLLVTPVFYYGATLEGNYTFYREIGKRVGLPIIIYNVVPTNLISTRALLKISEIDEVVGIKQVDPVILAEMSSVCSDKIRIYAACDELLYGAYISGAIGAISALVTVAPGLCVEQWKAFKSADQAKAMEIHRKLLPVAKSYKDRPFPGKIKKLLELQGRNVGASRHPILQPTLEEVSLMKECLQGAGLIY